jgi:hypothetical protein
MNPRIKKILEEMEYQRSIEEKDAKEYALRSLTTGSINDKEQYKSRAMTSYIKEQTWTHALSIVKNLSVGD